MFALQEKIYKKKLLFLCLIILTIPACGRMAPAETRAHVSGTDIITGGPISVAQPYEEAIQAYKEFLSQEKYKNDGTDDSMEQTHFAISDLDADDIPELIVSEDFNILSINEYYTYENGAITKIKGPLDGYPAWGSLYLQPSHKTYVYFRGGPAYEDEDDGNGYMPYTLAEYKVKNNQIILINSVFWQVCDFGSKAGTTEYTFNNKKCSAEKIEKRYQLKKSKTKDGLSLYELPEDNRVELIPNTAANRNAIDMH